MKTVLLGILKKRRMMAEKRRECCRYSTCSCVDLRVINVKKDKNVLQLIKSRAKIMA